MSFGKETGSAQTIREYMDGKYLGTLWDGAPDGSHTVSLADVANGAHVLELTLDGSTTTALFDFTKNAGVITPTGVSAAAAGMSDPTTSTGTAASLAVLSTAASTVTPVLTSTQHALSLA